LGFSGVLKLLLEFGEWNVKTLDRFALELMSQKGMRNLRLQSSLQSFSFIIFVAWLLQPAGQAGEKVGWEASALINSAKRRSSYNALIPGSTSHSLINIFFDLFDSLLDLHILLILRLSHELFSYGLDLLLD
jgi:hypothetical protein